MVEENTASEQEPVEDAAPVEPETPLEETPPEFMTPEQVQEVVSRGTNEMKTWMGRRDKDLFNQIGTIIDDRLSKKQETPEELSSKLLDDPVSTIRDIVNQTQSEQDSKLQSHQMETFSIIGTKMDSDPLYEDKELGNELVEEIKNQVKAGKVDARLAPDAAAEVLQAKALANVLRNRKKANALSSNSPGKAIGTLSPGTPASVAKPKMPELNEETKRWAEKWNYSDEDLLRIYGTKSKG